MIRKFILLLSAFASIVTVSKAQLCGTDIMQKRLIQQHPELEPKIAEYQQQMERDMNAALNRIDWRKLSKSRIGNDSNWYIIPVVVHVIHDYGAEDVSDNDIYTMIDNLNEYYQLQNDTSGVIQPFKKYVGNAHVYFRLATKDPVGNPTRGITRVRSYLTNGGDNQAKFDDWAPTSYMNIWIEKYIGLAAEGGIVAAYSQIPAVGAADPFVDGLIAGYSFISSGPESYVIAHEVGHYLNLEHPFGNNNSGTPSNGCGDDGVDDTPPTTGEFGVACNLYDTACAKGYAKVYPSISNPGYDSLVDYPDTANVQNIMTYSSCNPELMFTKGQVNRMHTALESEVAGRSQMVSDSNLVNVGVLDTVTHTFVPYPDLTPIADFSVNKNFICPGTSVIFTNHSWNDTITASNWTFSNDAHFPTATTTNTTNTFNTPGWVTVNLSVTGNNTGTSTLADSNRLYIADNNATNPVDYYQEFNPNGDVNKWPTFNYYNNEFKWKLVNNVGYYDNTSIEYTGFDSRLDPLNGIYPQTGMPRGDFDDMYSPAFDLTQFGSGSNVSLNFMYSGASRTSNSNDMTDTLEIDYSVNCGTSWITLKNLTKNNLANTGVLSIPYAPQSQTQWSLQSIALPNAAVTSKTFFRFRYKPNVFSGYATGTANPWSTGNNFYMDRINFSNYLLGLNTLVPGANQVAVAPNPTNGDAYVVINDAQNTTANVLVTDITGKTVYTTQQHVNGVAHIQIPKAAISVKGVYMVRITTGDQTHTEKLVVY